jgi:hypothetical protein
MAATGVGVFILDRFCPQAREAGVIVKLRNVPGKVIAAMICAVMVRKRRASTFGVVIFAVVGAFYAAIAYAGMICAVIKTGGI